MLSLQRVGPPKRRQVRYQPRSLYRSGFNRPARHVPVKSNPPVSAAEAARLASRPLGEGGLPAPLHGGKGDPNAAARSALDTYAISDRNFFGSPPVAPFKRKPKGEEWAKRHPKIAHYRYNHIRRENALVRLEIYEGMVKAKPIVKLLDQPASPAFHRGPITDFTSKSRQRMIERCAQINDKRLGLFVTLTYPDDSVPPTNEATKRHLAAMRKRILRLNEQAGGLWKCEIKERKTGQFQGQHVPHYHLIILGLLGHEKTRKNGRKSQVLSLPLLRRWIASAWGEIIGTQDTNFRKAQKVLACTDLTHLQRYVAKYAAKTGDDGKGLDWGKRWDWFGEISFSACTIQTIDIYEFILLKNQVVKWLLTSGHMGKIKYAAKIMDTEQGFTIYNLGAETIGGDGRRVLAALWSNALGQMI